MVKRVNGVLLLKSSAGLLPYLTTYALDSARKSTKYEWGRFGAVRDFSWRCQSRKRHASSAGLSWRASISEGFQNYGGNGTQQLPWPGHT